MNTFDFTINLMQLVSDLDAIDAFYGRHQDASVFDADGTTRITFHREAATLDEAIRSAVADVKSAGYEIRQIEVEPQCVGAN